MTFGQLRILLNELSDSKEDAPLLQQSVVVRESDGDYELETAVTLPGRRLMFVTRTLDDAI